MPSLPTRCPWLIMAVIYTHTFTLTTLLIRWQQDLQRKTDHLIFHKHATKAAEFFGCFPRLQRCKHRLTWAVHVLSAGQAKGVCQATGSHH